MPRRGAPYIGMYIRHNFAALDPGRIEWVTLEELTHRPPFRFPIIIARKRKVGGYQTNRRFYPPDVFGSNRASISPVSYDPNPMYKD